MGSVSVSSCRCCMFVSCVHPVAVLNAVFCMTCSLLMLVEDAIGDHTEEAYSKAGLITSLCHQYDVCENYVCRVYIGGYGGLSENGLCELCPVSFLVVGECRSVLL